MNYMHARLKESSLFNQQGQMLLKPEGITQNIMSSHPGEKSSTGYGNLIPVAWSILVMGISLAIVIVLYVWFGYLGPSFSEDVLVKQQTDLRERYDLPPQEVITDPEVLLTPPSMRGLNGENNSAT